MREERPGAQMEIYFSHPVRPLARNKGQIQKGHYFKKKKKKRKRKMTYILQVLVGAFELLRKLAFPHFQGNFRLVQNSLLPACQRIATNDSTLDISYTFASHRQ